MRMECAFGYLTLGAWYSQSPGLCQATQPPARDLHAEPDPMAVSFPMRNPWDTIAAVAPASKPVVVVRRRAREFVLP